MAQRLTICLLGNTGVGKSASGNTILGRQEFESKSYFKSVTKRCSEAAGTIFGKQISVIDTPGILCAGAEEQINSWCQDVLQCHRPCLFLVVVKVDRFTEEQKNAVEAVIRLLGDEGIQNSYLLFTKGDALDNTTVEEFINDDDESSLPEIVLTFDGRYHVFNNDEGGQEQVRDLLMKSGHLRTQQQIDPEVPHSRNIRLQDRRIVLLGLPGCGKSSSGNTILGSDRFRSGCDFEPVSTETVSASATVEGRQVTVVDTPGFTDKFRIPEQMYEEIMKTIVKASPGPHAFVIVVRLGRVSRQDSALLEMLPELFGSDVSKYTMVLFTHGDGLRGRSLHEIINSSSCISELVSMCGGRYCMFDNTGRRGRQQQVTGLLNQIDAMVTANGGQHCTSDMFRMVQTFINEATLTQPDQSPETSETPKRAAWRRFLPFVRRQWRILRDRFRQKFRRRRRQSSTQAGDQIPLIDQE